MVIKFRFLFGYCLSFLIILYCLALLSSKHYNKSNDESLRTKSVQHEVPLAVPDYNKQIQNLQDLNEVDYIEEFRQVAAKYGTDKVNGHSYHFIYGSYLGRIRTKKLRFLEIGLGCDMPYGPGRSLNLWREYLPNTKIHILEFDGNCGKKFQNITDKLFIGDQSNFTLLEQISKENTYDVIIDDGGHTRKQQINSLIGLWPALESRGMYVIEDMHTSIWADTHYLDLSISTVRVIEYFLHRFNEVSPSRKPLLDVYQAQIDKLFTNLLSVNCFKEACVLRKK